MGLLGWLFGRRPRTGVVWLEPEGAFSFNDVVGESRFQDALEAICGGRTSEGAECHCTAFLVPEPDNPADGNAVRVEIEGRRVGYLSRQAAVEFHAAAEDLGFHGRVAACDALIVGGWDRGDGDRGHFGVRLDIVWPPETAITGRR